MFFKAKVEGVYLYSAESWTLSKILKRRLGATHVYFGMHLTSAGSKRSEMWSSTRIFLQSPLSSKSAGWSLAMTKPIHRVLFRQPTHGKNSVGGQQKTFVDRLASDTGLGVSDMKTAMNNRKGWKELN